MRAFFSENFVKFRLFVVFFFSAILLGCGSPELESKVDAQDERLSAIESQLTQLIELSKDKEPTEEERKVNFGDGITLGDQNAEYAVIEFTDLLCPFCEKFHKDTFSKIKTELIDNGELLYVARELPLHTLHPQAPMAAVFARCAGDQDGYWDAKDIIFENRSTFNAETMMEEIVVDGLDYDVLADCIDGSDVKRSVQGSLNYAVQLGLQSTPTLLIGRNLGDGIVDIVKMSGAKDFETFLEALETSKELNTADTE